MDWINLAQDRELVAGCNEYGNEPSGSIKCGEFLDCLTTDQLLKKDSALWSSISGRRLSSCCGRTGEDAWYLSFDIWKHTVADWGTGAAHLLHFIHGLFNSAAIALDWPQQKTSGFLDYDRKYEADASRLRIKSDTHWTTTFSRGLYSALAVGSYSGLARVDSRAGQNWVNTVSVFYVSTCFKSETYVWLSRQLVVVWWWSVFGSTFEASLSWLWRNNGNSTATFGHEKQRREGRHANQV